MGRLLGTGERGRILGRGMWSVGLLEILGVSWFLIWVVLGLKKGGKEDEPKSMAQIPVPVPMSSMLFPLRVEGVMGARDRRLENERAKMWCCMSGFVI